MPKHRRKSDREKSFCKNTLTDKLSDITINDFANASGRTGRLKKSFKSTIVRDVQELRSEVESDLAWYDKDLDDFVVDLKQTSEDQENCDITDKPIKAPKTKKKGQILDHSSSGNDHGVEYPLDVWFLLSEYIRPEDIATFAHICCSARTVVNSPKFWFSLYKRYYNAEVALPQRLRPDCMERPHSLKACVIRALFLMYPPFIERVRSSAPFESEPHSLVAWYCILMWHQKQRTSWDFYFKFQRGSMPVQAGNAECSAMRPDLLEMLDDVHANPEDGCRVLQVTCLNFVSVPAVMGMYLSTVSLTVGHKMHHHKLKVTFSNTSYRRSMRHQDIGGTAITFDPVSNIRVLDWWHPQYPTND